MCRTQGGSNNHPVACRACQALFSDQNKPLRYTSSGRINRLDSKPTKLNRDHLSGTQSSPEAPGNPPAPKATLEYLDHLLFRAGSRDCRTGRLRNPPSGLICACCILERGAHTALVARPHRMDERIELLLVHVSALQVQGYLAVHTVTQVLLVTLQAHQ